MFNNPESGMMVFAAIGTTPQAGMNFRLLGLLIPQDVLYGGMGKTLKRSVPVAAEIIDDTAYGAILAGMTELLESARHAAARSVNSIMTATYWEIGRRIVKEEQRGKGRADYGEQIVTRLAKDLTKRCGRGFGYRNLYQMRQFYMAYPQILQTPSAKSRSAAVSAESTSLIVVLGELGKRFPLSWSHYVRLLSIEKSEALAFYEAEALRGGWSVRQLDRQIRTKFYERTLLSRNKAAMLKKGQKARPEDALTPEEEIKDPFVLEFLDLKDEYSESDLEQALIHHLESFLLELGDDFTFVGRQRRLRIDDEWFRVDLVFFHRRLRCLVLIDLKLDKLTAGDIGQMHLYLNYARAHWTHADENPPVGLILCAEHRAGVARYALEGLPTKVLAAEYRMALPSERTLGAELERTRKALEGRSGIAPKD
jgi:predicted nuclease of restriction endonuclease-like (RecB) superfamily